MEITLGHVPPRDRHHWLAPLIAPRPIAFVSTLSASGVGNLAPFSFFAMGGQAPQSVAFCPIANRDGKPKDTLRNILELGEFVINIVSREMAERVNLASAPYSFEVDEFDVTGFTRGPSTAVKPPRVLESPASLECRLFQAIPHGDGPHHSTWVIGEVLHLHVRDELLAADGYPDTSKVHPAARMGRADWAHITPDVTFTLERPTLAK